MRKVLVDKPLNDILSDPEDLNLIKNSYTILVKLKETSVEHLHITPTDLATILHQDELKEYAKGTKIYKSKMKNRSDTISEKCRELRDIGLIEEQKVKEKKDRREVYYKITEKGDELLSKYSKTSIENKYDKLKKSKQVYRAKQKTDDRHKEDVRGLIGMIIDQLPKVHEYYASPDSFENELHRIYAGDELPFEKDILYSDLSNHLGTFISFRELRDSIEEFKRGSVELPELWRSTRDKIQNDLVAKLCLAYDDDCGEIDTFSHDLVTWVLRGITIHIERPDESYYGQQFIEGDWEIEPYRTGFRIRAGAYVMMNVSEGIQDEKVAAIKDLMTGIKTADPYGYVKEFIEKRKALVEHRHIIIERLTQELHLSYFPGDCIYLNPSAN